MGVQPLPTDALGAVAAAGAMPGDDTVRRAKLLLQGTGMIAGAVAGNPVLVGACVRSWVHDRLRDAIARSFVQLVDPTPRT